ARIDVGHVDFDKWNCNSGERIANGERRVRVCTSIDESAVDFPAQAVHVFDDLSLTIHLRKREIRPEIGRECGQTILDFGESRFSIKLGLTHSQQVQVWSI